MEASYWGQKDVVNELLSHSADVSIQDNVSILYQVMLLEYIYLCSVLINSILKKIYHSHSSVHTVSPIIMCACWLPYKQYSFLLYEVPLRSLKVRLCVG